MDLTALLQWLAENGITALVKTDAERMAEHGIHVPHYLQTTENDQDITH